jgi:aminoglycoside/choline kinase family phosphotransferase
MIERRQAETTELRDRIDGYLRRSGLTAQSPRVVPLTGDASDRRYFRVLLPEPPSIVLSLYTVPFEFEKLSFVNVARLLDRMPVPIPAVLGHAEDLGILALEDLGDVTLQAHLGAASPAEHAALYRQAVALIATLQNRGAELESPDFIPYSIAFDVEKLTWESTVIKHFIEVRGVVVRPEEREALQREFVTLRETLAAEPRVPATATTTAQPHAARRPAVHHRLPDARWTDTYSPQSLLRDSMWICRSRRWTS